MEDRHLINSNKHDFFNGFGRFVNDGKEYEILLDGTNKPPAPWINVIANENFGFQISEAGAGFTWCGNSRENKITPWSNDPVSDQASEVLYIHDDLSGKIITPTSLGQTDKGMYKVRHGFGYTKFFHTEEDLEQKLVVFTPRIDPVKIWDLSLTNHSENERYFTISYYVEWVLGVDRNLTSPYIVSSYNNEHEYLSAKSVYAYEFRKHEAFIFSNEMIKCYTADRQEFLGYHGSIKNPAGITSILSCNTGVCYDPCGVIQISIAIKPQETKRVVFGLGQTDTRDKLIFLQNKYKCIDQVQKEFETLTAYWKKQLEVIQIETKDNALDYMINGWLVYQTIVCRLWARAAFYQCGGAYGFRDQLQDVLSLVFIDTNFLKKQIFRSAARQFVEGDVQHWWHPPTGVGVRTRITDDLLWLPYAVAYYIQTTKDFSILQEIIPYIKGPLLEEGQDDAMFTPEVSVKEESLYEHCKKTILRTSFGVHGLPLIGGGDWNDGMNKVGIEGKGESCWLAWFLYTVLEMFIPLCEHQQDFEFKEFIEETRTNLISALEKHTWDGEWYLRAFYDDGTKIGSKENDECKIDSISQSWSIISKGAKKARAKKAFESAWRYLVMEKEGVSLLLNPPFDKTEKNPGYIKNYFPGIRENGGQYSHAATWLAIAATIIGKKEKAYTLFKMLNPIYSASNKKDALNYTKEPYVMTADISFLAPYTGRGGWSWYTGSSAWMYQGVIRWFLGLNKEANELILNPAVPKSFGEYKITYRYKTSLYCIRITQKKNAQLKNGEQWVENKRITLQDDGKNYNYCYAY